MEVLELWENFIQIFKKSNNLKIKQLSASEKKNTIGNKRILLTWFKEWSIFMESKDTDTIRGLIIKTWDKIMQKNRRKKR